MDQVLQAFGEYSQFQSVLMAPSVLSAVLSGSALLAAANAQNFAGGSRTDDAFQYIQPLNTTILTEYGSSPPVYPSRKFSTSWLLLRLL